MSEYLGTLCVEEPNEMKMYLLHIKRSGTGDTKMYMKKKQGRFIPDTYMGCNQKHLQTISGLTPQGPSSSS